MIKSVFYGRDGVILDSLIRLHCSTQFKPVIADVTHNAGRIWVGAEYQPSIRLDIAPVPGCNVGGDYARLPFKKRSIDVIVFDPPHLPAASDSANSSHVWRERFGLKANYEHGQGDNVNAAFVPFLLEAGRVLRRHGIAIVKIVDIVHNHCYQWQHVELVIAARQLGMTPCDMAIKVPPAGGTLTSSTWENQYHLRRAHSYYIVIRNSDRCERLKEGSIFIDRPDYK